MSWNRRTRHKTAKNFNGKYSMLIWLSLKIQTLCFFYRIFRQLHIKNCRFLHDGERSAQVAPSPVERHFSEDCMYPFQHLHLPCRRTQRQFGECTWSRSGSTVKGRGEGGNTHRGGRCRAAARTVPLSCPVSGHRWAATPPELSPPPPEQEGRFYFSLFAHHSISDPYRWTTFSRMDKSHFG